jgi:hypothetical protein
VAAQEWRLRLEQGGTPRGPGASARRRRHRGTGAALVNDVRARVVWVVQGPAAGCAAKVLANTVHKAGGRCQVPHEDCRIVCAGRVHCRAARAAG